MSIEQRLRSGGTTLVEILVASALMTLSIASTLGFMGSSADTSESLKALTQLDQRAHRALERMVPVLMQAGVTTLPASPLTPPDSFRISFNQAIDFVAGAKVWGPEHRIEFQRDPNDIDDGIDNNGNGLVDEGRVILTIDPGQPGEIVTSLASGVAELLEGELPNGLDDNGNGLIDEPGLLIELDNSMLSLQLTLQAIGPGGRPLQRTVKTTFAVRN